MRALLDELVAEFDKPEHGVTIREVAGGYKMATKPEHHEAVRSFVKSLKPPLKLSLPALETLAVIAYKQPVTAPGDHGDPRRPGRRRAQDAARPQADRSGRAQERHRQADSVQDHQGIPDPVRIEGLKRTAVAQGVRGDPAYGVRRRAEAPADAEALQARTRRLPSHPPQRRRARTRRRRDRRTDGRRASAEDSFARRESLPGGARNASSSRGGSW